MSSIENIVVNYFKNVPSVLTVILFGSFAENRSTDKSDVDIGVFCDPDQIPPVLTIIEWREEMAQLLNREVDLVCLNNASPIIGMQVAVHGKILLSKNIRAYEQYQMTLFTDYAELKELRAPMEEDILKRKIYDRS